MAELLHKMDICYIRTILKYTNIKQHICPKSKECHVNVIIHMAFLSMNWDRGIRTPECWNQNPVPYRLAISQ